MLYLILNIIGLRFCKNFAIQNYLRKGAMISATQQEENINAAGGIPITPIGAIRVSASPQGVTRVHICAPEEYRNEALPEHQNQNGTAREILEQTIRQIQEYFEGKRRQFEVAIDWSGLSGFTRRVLQATRKIGYGQISTYGDIAKEIGQTKASRAVGGALGRNPLVLIVPCHRVIAGDGGLQGFSSPGGVKTKLWLLEFEGRKMRNGKVVR
jgi:methylated-DNA-[protein]-cysteine S-methyltransferase